MDSDLMSRIRRTLSHVVESLVRKSYASLETLTGGVRLKAEHIEAGVTEYGKTLAYPPDDAYEEVDVLQIGGRTPAAYSVRFRLFTQEEGRSDLELQATFIDDDDTSGIMRVEIDGILVP